MVPDWAKASAQANRSVPVNTRKKLSRSLGAIVFLVGILLGMALAGSAVWADFEAQFYGFDHMGDEPIRTLRCPVLMTASETGRISASFANGTQKPIQQMVRADFSNFGPARSVRATYSLTPGEKLRVDWAVTSADIDLRWFIFARVYAYPAYPYPFREATCGIMVINLPGITGGQLFALALSVCLVCILIGLGLWEKNRPPQRGRRLDAATAMKFLAVIVLLALLTSLRDWWMIAGLFLIVAVVLINVLVYSVLTEGAGLE
jgi:hypothetical protein